MMRAALTRSPTVSLPTLPGRHGVCAVRPASTGGRRSLQVCNVAAAPPMPAFMPQEPEQQPDKVQKHSCHAASR